MNLSGTRGLGLDMEPWAYEARGRNSGRKQGLREGREEGYAEGFDDGMAEGVALGRRQAITEANRVIEKINAEFSNERDDANRISVSMNALRRTIEILIEKNPNSATYIRKLFKSNYEDEVRSGLDEGSLKIALHLDREFLENTPRMGKFLLSSI